MPGTVRRSHPIVLNAFVVLAVCAAWGRAESGQSHEDLVDETNFALQESLDRGKYDLAVKFGHKLVELEPKKFMPPYMLARAYAGQGDADEAITWLGTAAERGFYYRSTLQRHAEFDALRTRPAFKEVAARIDKQNEKALELFKKRAERATILTIVPPDLDATKPAPLIVALHGYGAIAKNIATPWRDIAAEAGAILVAPQAVERVGSGYNWGVIEQAEYLVFRAIKQTEEKYNIDKARIVLTGFSQGAHISFLMGLRYPNKFAGVIPICGYYDHRLTPVPETPTPGLPRFFIMTGANDDHAENNRDAARRLKAIDAPVELRIYDGIGHSLPENYEPELRDALRFALGK